MLIIEYCEINLSEWALYVTCVDTSIKCTIKLLDNKILHNSFSFQQWHSSKYWDFLELNLYILNIIVTRMS